MNQPFDCDYFIRKFEAIPDEQWTAGIYNDGSAHCAIGHCVEGIDSEAMALRLLVRKFLDSVVVTVNDGSDSRYQQPTPRARILAALHDIKSQQEQAAEAFELRPLNLTKPERKETIESIA